MTVFIEVRRYTYAKIEHVRFVGVKRLPLHPVKHNIFLVIAPWDKWMTFLINGLAIKNYKLDIDGPTGCGVA